MENKLSEHIKSFFEHIMYFQDLFGSFCRRFFMNVLFLRLKLTPSKRNF